MHVWAQRKIDRYGTSEKKKKARTEEEKEVVILARTSRWSSLVVWIAMEQKRDLKGRPVQGVG